MFKDYERTNYFTKRYEKLDKITQNIIIKTIRQLFTEPLPNSLRFKKVKGCQGIYEISGNMDIRITFSIDGEKNIIFRNCGHHDEVLKNP
jgi:mRNA-degrading endonuclease YafQ of YafQ-DinJ toxin-antitoxin module